MRAIVAVLLCVFSFGAHAGTDIWSLGPLCNGSTATGATAAAVNGQIPAVNNGCIPTNSYSNPVCAAFTGVGTGGGSAACSVDHTTPPSPTVLTDSYAITITCSGVKKLDAGGICTTGVEPAPACTTGERTNFWGSGTSPGVASTPCMQGCTIDPEVIVSGSSTYNGLPLYTGVGKKTGATCSISTAGTGAPPVSQCPTGKCPGTVNGSAVCLPCSTASPSVVQTKTSSVTTPSGGGSPSTTTSISTTTNVGGGSSTTTSITNPDGSTTVAQSAEPQKSDEMTQFCKQNPNSPMCKESSWSGSCATSFTGGGDAVAVAIAQAVNAQKCALLDATSTERSLYDTIKAGGDPVVSPAHSSQLTSSAINGSIDQTAFLGSSSCIADAEISMGQIMGRDGATIVIPWSQYCWLFQMMATLMVAASLLSAAFIVFK